MGLYEVRNRRLFVWPWFSGLVLLLGFVLSSLPQPVRAETIETSSAAAISVKAAISPARVVIVDHGGVIQKILSNTRQIVEPTVRQDVYNGSAVAYTPDIRQQYTRIMQTYQLWHVRGIVYDASVNPPALEATPLLTWPTNLLITRSLWVR